MMFFRKHRGSFKDSIETMIPFENFNEIKKHLTKKLSDNIVIEPYCYDKRLSTECFIVLNNENPIGFVHSSKLLKKFKNLTYTEAEFERIFS